MNRLGRKAENKLKTLAVFRLSSYHEVQDKGKGRYKTCTLSNNIFVQTIRLNK